MILVTGSTGFIGRALMARLERLGHAIVTLNSENGGVVHADNLHRLKGQGIRHVFHLAGRTFVPDSWKYPSEFTQVNVIGTQNVLEFCRETGASLTYVSAYLYGQPESLPISEESPIKPNNLYALTKHLAEKACEFYAREFGVKMQILRPFNVFGIGQNHKFLIPSIIDQALHSDVITLKDLRPKRDFVYLEDLIDVFELVLDYEQPFALFNIGAGNSISVRQIVEVVQAACGVDKPVHSMEERRKNEIDDVIADIHKVNAELCWYPKHAFRQGIEEIVANLSARDGSKRRLS